MIYVYCYYGSKYINSTFSEKRKWYLSVFKYKDLYFTHPFTRSILFQPTFSTLKILFTHPFPVWCPPPPQRTSLEVKKPRRKNNVRGLALDIKFNHFWFYFLCMKNNRRSYFRYDTELTKSKLKYGNSFDQQHDNDKSACCTASCRH